jgi:hypothetical protein
MISLLKFLVRVIVLVDDDLEVNVAVLNGVAGYSCFDNGQSLDAIGARLRVLKVIVDFLSWFSQASSESRILDRKVIAQMLRKLTLVLDTKDC